MKTPVAALAIGILASGCSSTNVPQVPKARMAFERPLASVTLPTFQRIEGRVSAVPEGRSEPPALKSKCDIEFLATFQGESQDAPRLLIAEVHDKFKNVRHTVKLVRRAESGSAQTRYRAVNGVEVLHAGTFQISLYDFGPPPSRDAILTVNLEAAE